MLFCIAMQDNTQITSLGIHIVRTLSEAGYTAYFAGGWVRDYLLGNQTDEIDIATNASPDEMMKLFPKTIPVGVTFGVVIVVLEGIQFELSTFRKDHPYLDGRHPDGFDYSTPEIDASRRDFTINGMFYDPLSHEIYDFVGGQDDLKKGIIRAIGNPLERFQEDRLRMIRAIRFAARFNFAIEEKTANAVSAEAHTLFPSVSMERIWQEFNKMASHPRFDLAIIMMHRFNLLQTIFPDLKETSVNEIEKWCACFSDFPKNTPTICYIMQLFPFYDLKQREHLCRYLKTSNEELKLATFLFHSELLLKSEGLSLAEWAHFYAHPDSELVLKIEEAKLELTKRHSFHESHAKRHQELHIHIERIQKKRPLVNAEHLKKEGIVPGKLMGTLLLEAERLVINQNLNYPEKVIETLKKSPYWP